MIYRYLGRQDGSRRNVDREIPINILIDNALQFTGSQEGFCTIDVCGIESTPTKVFASKEEYIKSGMRYAPVSLVPIEIFSPDPKNKDFEQSPTVLFTGKVIDVDSDPDAAPDMSNCCVQVESLDFMFSLYFR